MLFRSLVGIASRTLRENGLDEQADEMRDRIIGGECGTYYEALNVIAEYVNITGPEEADTMKLEGFG